MGLRWEPATSRGGPLPPGFDARLSANPHQPRRRPAGAARSHEHRGDVGRVGSLRVSLKPRDSYLHRSGPAPSPAAGCSPRRRSEAGGSCALSCSSLGRTSAWWGLARPARPHSLSKRRRASPPNVLRGGGGEGTCGKAGEGRGRRPGGAARQGRRARWRSAGGSGHRPRPRSPRPLFQSADNSASNRPPPTPFTPLPSTVGLGRPGHAATGAPDRGDRQ